MSQINKTRKGCKDVFHAFMVESANYEGKQEMPCINPIDRTPNKLIPFSKAVGNNDHDAWVHFYEDDVQFERLWNNPRKYLPILQKYNGVITPDFSIYRDMPLVMQEWNIYRSRAIGHWLQTNGIDVIANVRWGDDRSFEFFCDGVPKHSIIAIGSHGCIKSLRERAFFIKGLDTAFKKLNPTKVIVYGAAPDNVFAKYRNSGVEILQFNSLFCNTHRKKVRF